MPILQTEGYFKNPLYRFMPAGTNVKLVGVKTSHYDKFGISTENGTVRYHL